MLKKSIVYIILFSMALHCSCRLGFFDNLYQMRHQIALTIGLIAEIPIAMCSSDYDFDRLINIDTSESDERMPISVLTHEINLFYTPIYQLPSRDIELFEVFYHFDSPTAYQDYPDSVFHPPAFA